MDTSLLVPGPSLPEVWKNLFERASNIARYSDLKMLYRETLNLLIELTAAEGGAMYQYLGSERELQCYVTVNVPSDAIGECYAGDAGLFAQQMAQPEIKLYENLQQRLEWKRTPAAVLYPGAYNFLRVPFASGENILTLAVLFNAGQIPHDQVAFVVNRLSTEIEKAIQGHMRWRDNARLQTLIAIIGELTSTLDRDRLLRLIINYAAELLDAEASSLFLLDAERHELVLHLASNWKEVPVEKMRIPEDKGIIGEAVTTGQPAIIHDTRVEQRHYGYVDKKSGFVTYSALAVPMRVYALSLGEDMGQRAEHTIGGLEALNKRQGQFSAQDAHLLGLLANQAATIMEVANLYSGANELFFDVIEAMVTSIDAKDPYTQGHSRRVSDFSIAIASELGLAPDFIHDLRIGSLLHDVGKIGVPDSILCKAGRLEAHEFQMMKQHPTIGWHIMSQVRLLRDALPPIIEHHERLDGSGYPNGLKGDEISIQGRIVAAADVFDALTSDRPYRSALSTEEALDYLQKNIGTHFDAHCVEALTRAYLKGQVKSQKERDALQRAQSEL
ncbi:MAG: GAF domain-containing protein [Anaerolineales bacterium]